jgi:hypothetical protein
MSRARREQELGPIEIMWGAPPILKSLGLGFLGPCVTPICVAPNCKVFDQRSDLGRRPALFIAQLINGMVLYVDAVHNQ